MQDGLRGSFGALDWAVVIGLFAFTTWIGARKAGEQATLRDYFLGGRRLPWYAVAGSIVATEISAVTFVSFTAVVARAGGDLTYLQIPLIGSLLAKCAVAWLLVPAYYEREIYSPYDYMGQRLGAKVRAMATLLFSLGGVVGQAARVYLTALVLEVLLHEELLWLERHTGIAPLVASVSAIGVVAVVWTWMGGIATVVWTDLVLFLLFLAGIAVALASAAASVEGGVPAVLDSARAAGKLRLFDFSGDLARAYTFQAALFASTFGLIGSYGTDQLMAQRLFCCGSAREARRAIVASYVAVVVIVLVGMVGLALFAHYQQHPLEGAARALVEAKPDRLFPVFVVEEVPHGLKGLVVAGAFAAAISSLDSILAALSQTTLAALYLPWRRRRTGGIEGAAEERRTLLVSRALVLAAAVLLCWVALSMQVVAKSYASILDLALGVASYTGGALIAGFFLAFLPLRIDGSGFLWSAPLSVATICALTARQEWAQRLLGEPEPAFLALALLGLALWLALRVPRDLRAGRPRGTIAAQSLAWSCGLALLVLLARFGHLERPGPDGLLRPISLAWPWYLPIGSLVAFGLGWLLARPACGRCR